MNALNEIIPLWEGIVKTMDETNACGYCWEFYAPLTEIKLNTTRTKEGKNCCVHVFLIRNKAMDFRHTPIYTNRNIISGYALEDNYDIYFLVKSKRGLNNYNELPHHDVKDSRYETIFRPIRDCIESRMITGICGTARVTQFSGNFVYDYQDEQYYGYKISIQQRWEKML